MGRSGGGGGHSSGGHGGGSHHHSSHHSSSSFSSSRSSSSYHSGPRGGGYSSRPGYGGGYGYGPRNYGPRYSGGYGYGRPVPPPPGPRPYRRASSGAGCGGFIALLIIAFIFMCIVAAVSDSGVGSVSGSNLAEYAEQQYKSVFNGREDGMLMVITEDDEGEIVYGTKANGIMDRYVDKMWDFYDANYNDDLGKQIKGMFFDTVNEINKDGGVTKVKSDKGFDNSCYKDHLNWVDTKSNLVDGAKAFYDATGIQPYIMFVKNKSVNQATNKSSGVLKTLIIALAVIIVISILFSWWKKRVAQKNKEQQDLENILSTPLESFGSTPMDDLKDKYDNNQNNGQ